nr:MAG TPA: hypothetical protein [Caudoviricetes sp.]
MTFYLEAYREMLFLCSFVSLLQPEMLMILLYILFIIDNQIVN